MGDQDGNSSEPLEFEHECKLPYCTNCKTGRDLIQQMEERASDPVGDCACHYCADGVSGSHECRCCCIEPLERHPWIKIAFSCGGHFWVNRKTGETLG